MQLLHLKQTSGVIFFKALALLLSFLPPVVFIHGSILQTDQRKKKKKAEQTTEDSDPTSAAQFLQEKTTLLLSATLLSGGDGDGTGAAKRGSRKQGDKERIILQASSDIAPSNGRRVTVLGLVLLLKSLPIAQFMNKKHSFVCFAVQGISITVHWIPVPRPPVGYTVDAAC
jgi:hypothetical protein